MAQRVRKPASASIEQATLDHDIARNGEMGEDEGAPRTPLGAKLLEIRRRIEASGQPLLDWDGVEGEVAERRGGARELER